MTESANRLRNMACVGATLEANKIKTMLSIKFKFSGNTQKYLQLIWLLSRADMIEERHMGPP